MDLRRGVRRVIDVNRIATTDDGGQIVTRGLERPAGPSPPRDPSPPGDVVVPHGYYNSGSQSSSAPWSPGTYSQSWQAPSYGQPAVNQSSYQVPYSPASAQNPYGSPQGQGYAYSAPGQGGYYAPNNGNAGYGNYPLQSSPIADPGPSNQGFYQGQSYNSQPPPLSYSQSTPGYTYQQNPPPRVFNAPPQVCRYSGQPNHDPGR